MSDPAVYITGNRFSPVDENHHGALLWIAASLSLAYFVLSCLVRVIIFYQQYTRDTLCLLVATVFGFIQVMVTYSQLALGYGTSNDLLSSRDILAIEKRGYVADILFIVTLALSKVSTVWFIARLTPNQTHAHLCILTAALCVAWGLGSVFSLALKCDLAKPWVTIEGKCTHMLLRWQLISAFDVLTELLILALIIGIIYKLRMPTQKKFIVVLGFLFRFPLIALAIIHVKYVQIYLNSKNDTFDQIIPSVLISVQMGWGLISATIPCLRSFVAGLGSGYLGASLNANLREYSLSSSGRSGRRKVTTEESFVLNKISVSQKQETTVVGGRESSLGLNDPASIRTSRGSEEGSQDFIIRKTVDYQISYKDGENLQQRKEKAV